MENSDHLFLRETLSQPTAPFREQLVISRVMQELSSHQIPFFTDPIGNVIVGISTQKEYLKLIRKKSSEPVRVFIAHTDHPGFHGLSWKSDSELIVQWYGGSPTEHLNGARVWLADQSGVLGYGKMQNARLIASGRALDTATIELESGLMRKNRQATHLSGGFSFRAPMWNEGDLIYTKAADDLIGVYSIVTLAKKLFKKSKGKSKKSREIPFLGILTRAEEVGFIGAIGHFELGWLKQSKRSVICISLETSRTLPGAEIGKGPVVRLGDRFTVFHPGGLQVLSNVAKLILPEKHQRRIMDGGTCEASAATVYGFPSIGISVPLGNYHNQSFEGGPDAAPANGPAPEFVHGHDIEGLIDLCHGIMKNKLPWNAPWNSKLAEFKKNLREYRPLLKAGQLKSGQPKSNRSKSNQSKSNQTK